MSTTLGIIASSRQQGPPLLLDAYPGAAAAYSLRKLRTAYTSSAIRVRRSGDNTETDIGFDVNGNLNTTTLLTFVGGGDGFISKWYDQSGNANDGLQTIFGAQPKIVISGVLQTQNGLPTLFYDNYSVEFTNLITSSGDTSAYIVGRGLTDGRGGPIIGHSNPGGSGMVLGMYISRQYLVQSLLSGVANYALTATNSADFNFNINNIYVTNVFNVYKNNTLIPIVSSGTFGTSSNDFWNIGRYGNNFSTFGYISEVILYKTNQLSNRTGINGNINTYYSIYPVPPVVSDPDAQAFVDRVFAAGGSVTSTEANAVNTLTIGLKASGIWSLMKVIYPFVGASAAACAQNLKSSSFTGTFVNPWTFTSAGIQQFGTSHMNTNFNNQANWTSTSNGSMGFVSATNETGTTVVDMGTSPNLLNLNDASAICANYNGTYFAAINCTSIVPGVANPSTIGFFVTSRLNSSTFSKYKRGSSTINLTNTDPIGTNTNTSIYLSAGNQANNALFFSKKLYNFCFIGDGLTQTQVDDYWTLLQTFNSSLGR
jgi:hypothetical protein